MTMMIFNTFNFIKPNLNAGCNISANAVQQSLQNFNITSPLNKDVVSFGSINVDKDDAISLRRIKDLTCARCGKPMVDPEEYDDFTEKDFKGSAYQVLKKLHKCKKKMRTPEKNVYDILCKAAKKNPDADLQTLMSGMYDAHLNKLIEKQIKVLNRIEKHAQHLSPFHRKIIEFTVLKSRNIVKGMDPDEAPRRIKIINMFKRAVDDIYSEKAIKNMQKNTSVNSIVDYVLYELNQEKDVKKNKKILNDIIKEFDKMPSSQNDVDAFIVKYYNHSNREIGKRLLSSALPTLDHFLAASKGGEDDFANLLVFCAKCNQGKGCESGASLLKKDRKFIRNIRKNVNRVAIEISKDPLSTIDDYPGKVRKTVIKHSKNKRLKQELSKTPQTLASSSKGKKAKTKGPSGYPKS